jgi:hypothetical protein
MWKPYRLSIEQHAPNCRIVYDKFHVLQHANAAVDEVHRAEFFRNGGRHRGLIKGKPWLLLTRWWNLSGAKRQDLNTLFAINIRHKPQVAQSLSAQGKPGAPLVLPLRRSDAALPPDPDRSTALATLAALSKTRLDDPGSPGRYLELLPDQDPVGVVEAVNGNNKSLLRRGRRL